MKSLRQAVLSTGLTHGLTVFTAPLVIQDHLDNASVTDEQRYFLQKILRDFVHHERLKNNGYFAKLKSSIERELNNASIFNVKYKDLLNRILSCLTDIEKSFTGRISKKFAHEIDLLYRETEEQYQGTVMLPVIQEFDYRLGAQGQCEGYVTEWNNCLIRDKKPFGIDPHQSPVLKPIQLNSTLGYRYPELNHLAILNERIGLLQELQLLPIEQITALRKADALLNAIIPNEKQIVPDSFYSHASQIVDDLIKQGNQNTGHGYILTLGNLDDAHAVGFKKQQDGSYHFFDPGYGWFRFKNAADFKKWLPRFFEISNYDNEYHEYGIIACSTKSELESKSRRTSLLTSAIHAIAQVFYYLAVSVASFFSSKSPANAIIESVPPVIINQEKPKKKSQDDTIITAKRSQPKAKTTQDDIELFRNKNKHKNDGYFEVHFFSVDKVERQTSIDKPVVSPKKK